MHRLNTARRSEDGTIGWGVPVLVSQMMVDVDAGSGSDVRRRDVVEEF